MPYVHNFTYNNNKESVFKKKKVNTQLFKMRLKMMFKIDKQSRELWCY